MKAAPKKSAKAKLSPPAADPAEEKPIAPQLPFPVVGIGASAGGLEAFTELLSHLPENTGMAFVLIQHLDPDHPSQLADLLARATKMSVLEVKSGTVLAPNHIYVIPPNANLQLSAGKLELIPRGGERIPHPVDFFFRSLAREQQHSAIGVVLSGTGSDGMMGLEEIKGAGGLTFAQDEESARFAGMPQRAASSTVDFVLPPEKIAAELTRIGLDPYVGRAARPEADAGDQEKEFQRVLILLRSQIGVDFRQYRDSTIKRRIQRRMLVHSRPTLAEYVQVLEKNHEELQALFEDVLIGVTSFFRDPEMFEALKTSVFPQIARTASGTIRIWVAACSTGQEVYSLAIALLEFLEQKPGAPGIQIFGTDVNDAIGIGKARRGLYPESIAGEVSPERLRRFFTKEEGGYRVNKSLREMCIFARQNIVADPPFSRMDLICCRNMLIYLTPPLQRRVISTLHYALNPTGYLVLGNSETVGPNSDLFELLDRRQKIFSKKGLAVRPFSHYSAEDLKAPTPAASRSHAAYGPAPLDFQKEADRILLGRYAPAGVLVNSTLEVLQFRGRTGDYLELPVGEASFNLLKMARGNLPLELGRAIQEARRENAPVRRSIRLGDTEPARRINLEIIPLRFTLAGDHCYLVLFEEGKKARDLGVTPPAPKTKGKPAGSAARTSAPKEGEVKQLRHDLKAAHEYLQTITEQHDAANEELKCANEEVLSSNEELQSTNEQLGTAKEELQSTNEELTTLNDELQTRNVEVNQLNNDLNNLLTSVQIPILMLGNDLRIRRFNPSAGRMLQLNASDLGRAITTLASPLIGADLETTLLEVIGKVAAKELEVRNREGHWFALRLNPYRTADHGIEGVVAAWVDIDALKRIQEIQTTSAQTALDESEQRFQVAANNAPVLIWMSGPDKLCYWFNKPWLDFTGRTLEQEVGKGWAEGVHPDDLTNCLAIYEKEFNARRNFALEYRLRRHDGEYRWLLDQGVPRFQGTEFVGYIGSCTDITDRKLTEAELRRSQEELKGFIENASVGLHWVGPDGIIQWANAADYEPLGYRREEFIGHHIAEFHADAPVIADILERLQHREKLQNHPARMKCKDGSIKDVLIDSSVLWEDSRFLHTQCFTRDVTEQKRTAEELAESFDREKLARQTAEAASRAKDDFLAALSHELRTPLNPVLLLASEAAENPKLAAGVRADFETIRKNVELEARLIDDLLDLTHITAGKLSLNLQEMDVHAVLQDAVATVRADAKEKKLQLKVNLRAEAAVVNGDAVRLQQVFWNVLKNAVKFTPPGGEITVETDTRADARRWSVKISDTGHGLTPEELKRAFAAFAQGDHATGKPHRFGGLGLGLAISRKLVELHAGDIRVTSAGRDQGATFTIELPLSQKVKEKVPAIKSPTKKPPASDRPESGRRILLVEDHEPTRTALSHLLVRRGYEVKSAGSLAEARALAKQHRFDLLISDIGLPDGYGFDLMTELQTDHPELRGIALTGYGMDEDIARSRNAGFVSHLVKPVRVQSLEAALAQALAGG